MIHFTRENYKGPVLKISFSKDDFTCRRGQYQLKISGKKLQKLAALASHEGFNTIRKKRGPMGRFLMRIGGNRK